MFSCELWGISRNNFLTEYVRMTASNDLFWKKKTVFSCEFCEIFQNTFFTKKLWTTAEHSYQLSFSANTSAYNYVTKTLF